MAWIDSRSKNQKIHFRWPLHQLSQKDKLNRVENECAVKRNWNVSIVTVGWCWYWGGIRHFQVVLMLYWIRIVFSISIQVPCGYSLRISLFGIKLKTFQCIRWKLFPVLKSIKLGHFCWNWFSNCNGRFHTLWPNVFLSLNLVSN